MTIEATTPEAPGRIAGPFADRLFYEVIRAGIAHFAATPAAWDPTLGFLGETERKIAEVVWRRSPPTVRMGYARSNDPFPIVSVALQSESAAAPEVFGDEFYDDGDDDLVEGQWRDYQIAITVHADHIDVAAYVYRAVDAAITANLGWLKSMGLVNPRFLDGGDLMPNPGYLPESIYSRVARWGAVGLAAHVITPGSAPSDVSVVASAERDRGMPGRVEFG